MAIRLSALGDVAISAPLVKEYARCNPSVQFYMMSQPAYRPLFDGVENLHFIPADIKKDSPDYCGDRKGLKRLASQIVNEYKITDIADIHGVIRSRTIGLYARLMTFFGIKYRRIDKRRKERKLLCSAENKVLAPITRSQRCMEEVFVRIGLEDLGFALKDGVLPAKKKDSQGFRIGVAPFAKHTGKQYPLNLMEKVIEALSGRENTEIFLYGGGEKEIALMRQWAEKYPHTALASGKNDLGGEVSSMASLDVMLSMDSANMHLASLAGTPVVSIWGATHPFAGFYGWRQDPSNAVQADLACRPCSVFGKEPCSRGDYACLNMISPVMVLNKIYEVLHL